MVHIPEHIEKVYQQRRSADAARLAVLRRQLQDRDPALRDLERQYRQQGMELVRLQIAGQEAEAEQLKQTLVSLDQKRDAAYEAAYPQAMDRIYFCPLCHDRGIYRGQLCACALDIIEDWEAKNGLSFPPPRVEFSDFQLDLFSAEISPDAYEGKSSPRKVAAYFYRLAQQWVESFPETTVRAYFFGPPGTGKTWLSALVAYELRKRGYRVAFIRTMDFVDLSARLRVLEQSYHPDTLELETMRERMRYLETADVLVLDDLGSESKNDFAYNDLIRLLDNRAEAKHKSTFLTGNLKPDLFARSYDERLGSRLIGNFRIFPFAGPDLRLSLAHQDR